jgi:glycosyltransferase involved in cell wall biosynthesis
VIALAQDHAASFKRLAVTLENPRIEMLVVVPEGGALASDEYPERVRIVPSPRKSTADLATAGLDAARGSFVYFALQDSEFAFGALERILEILEADSDVGVLYTDHAVQHPRQRGPWIVPKPDYSPERLRSQFYYGETAFYRLELVRRLEWPDRGVPGAEFYDLALRASQGATKVGHLAEILTVFSTDVERPGVVHGDAALESTRIVLERYLTSSGGGTVRDVNPSGIHDTRRSVIDEPLVSIVIPTRGSFGDVRGKRTCLILEAVRSILDRSTYGNYELVVVMDDVAEQDVVDELVAIAGDRLRLVWWRQPFSFSGKVNFGAFHSAGEYLLFLNDDTEVISADWIESMLALGQRPGAGMVGSMLYFEDDTIQHAGHIYEGGDAGHIGMFLPRGSEGPLGAFLLEREALGVTAACSLVSKSVFEEAGGFSLLLPGNFNDVDLCLKINELGYTSYWTPHAELYHYESKSRDSRVARYEVETAWGRWEWKLDDRSYWPYGVWADDAIG